MEQENKPPKKRDTSILVLSAMNAVAGSIAAYAVGIRFLADDLMWGRKSSEKITNSAILTTRDQLIAERSDKSWFGKLTTYPKALSTLSGKIKEEGYTWSQGFKAQSTVSKIGTIAIIGIAISGAYFFIRELVKPSREVTPPSEADIDATQVSQHNSISAEEAKALADKQAAPAQNKQEVEAEKRQKTADAPKEMAI